MDWQDRIIEKWQEKAVQQVELAKDEVIKTLKEMWKQGLGSQGTLYSNPTSTFGMYSESHGRRRHKKGLPTSKVNLEYSGTLIKSLKESERLYTPQKVEVKISFMGRANRRSDQKDTLTNSQLADYLGIQFDQDIIKLNENDRKRIQEKYGVRITYD